jgi:hypothetical protein
VFEAVTPRRRAFVGADVLVQRITRLRTGLFVTASRP